MEASTKNCFNELVTESTDQVPGYTALILTPAYQLFASICRELLVTEKTTIFTNSKKLAKYSSCLNSLVTPAYQFCGLEKITVLLR